MTALDRALELDDDAPDERCPGCGFYFAHDGLQFAYDHRADQVTPESTWWHRDQRRWTDLDELPDGYLSPQGYRNGRCPWTADMLSARSIRRQLIREQLTDH